MRALSEYIMEAQIKLPYNFDIYNEGAKNVKFKITKKNIYKLYFKLEDWVEEKDKDNPNLIHAIQRGKDYDQFIKLPLPATAVTYKEFPTKSSTNNWTKIPEIATYMYAGAWYSDKFVEYNYNKYNHDWDKWLTYLKPFMKGKISATLKESDEKDDVLEIVINDKKFNEERETKIKELSNPDLLKKWADEADAKEKAEIEKRKKEEEEKEKKQKAWDKWWNSLSDDERLSWSMGYGRGSGSWTGD